MGSLGESEWVGTARRLSELAATLDEVADRLHLVARMSGTDTSQRLSSKAVRAVAVVRDLTSDVEQLVADMRSTTLAVSEIGSRDDMK